MKYPTALLSAPLLAPLAALHAAGVPMWDTQFEGKRSPMFDALLAASSSAPKTQTLKPITRGEAMTQMFQFIQ